MIPAGLAMLYFPGFIARFCGYPIDDSFIHLRIARNVADHGLPYFNLGERVLGATPHLWINLLALCLRLTHGSDSFLPFLAFFFTAATYFPCAMLLRERYSGAGALVIAGFILALFLLGPAAGLMEVPLATALCVWSLVLYSKGWFRGAGFVASLGVWTRPELVMLVCFSFLFSGSRAGRWRYVTGALPSGVAYLAYCLFYFGTVVPLPMIAKPHVYPVSLMHDLNYGTIAEAATPWIYHLFGANDRTTLWCASLSGLSLLLVCAGLAIAALAEKCPRWATVAALSSLSIFATHLWHGAILFSWYLPTILVPLVLSLFILVPFRGRWPVAVVTLFFVGFLPYCQVGLLDIFAFFTGQDQFEEEFATGWRVRQLLKAGRELNEIDPSATVLAPEIGAIGWVHPGRIIDACALVTPASLKYYLVSRKFDLRVRPEMVTEFNPDYVVGLGFWMSKLRGAIAKGTLRGYREIKRYPIVPPDVARATGVRGIWDSRHIGVVGKYASFHE